MLFTCAPRSCAATRPAARKVARRGNKSFAVDLHCHAQTPAADQLAKQTRMPARDPVVQHGSQRTAERQKQLQGEIWQKLTSIEQRLADMDKMGIDVQAISSSPSQYYYRLEPDLGRQTSRLVNERLAQIVASHPDRFVALGTVPMQEPKLAVAELEYCMKKIYFDTMVFGHTQLEHLVNLWGANRVVIGTDYPYDMGYYKPVDFVNGARLSRAQKGAIIGGNGAKLLGLKPKKR